jgi:hypothetical protein
MISMVNGGESGIRTHGTLSRTHAFQACALNHSAISPTRTARIGAVACAQGFNRPMGKVNSRQPSGVSGRRSGRATDAVALLSLAWGVRTTVIPPSDGSAGSWARVDMLFGSAETGCWRCCWFVHRTGQKTGQKTGHRSGHMWPRTTPGHRTASGNACAASGVGLRLVPRCRLLRMPQIQPVDCHDRPTIRARD